MNRLVNLVLLLLVACACWWAATQLMAAFGIGDPIRTVVQVLLILFAVVAAAGNLRDGQWPWKSG